VKRRAAEIWRAGTWLGSWRIVAGEIHAGVHFRRLARRRYGWAYQRLKETAGLESNEYNEIIF